MLAPPLSQLITERRSVLSPGGSAALDMLRAAAALLVLVGHVRNLFFADYQFVESKNIFVSIVYFATGLGHEAVIVFFVLSGYFIGSNVLGALAGGYWSWRWYLVRRLSRLWIVLLPALCAGAAIDIAGLWLFGDARGPYGAEGFEHLLPQAVEMRLNVSTFLGNALFLQDILVPPFGSNGPLWSLAFEFAYYLLFPCLLIGTVAATTASRRIVHLGLAAAIAILAGNTILLYFSLWLLGAIALMAPRAACLARGTVAATVTAILAVAGLVLALAAARIHLLHPQVSDLLVGLACAFLVYVVSSARRLPGCVERTAKIAAGFSYTVYLFHLPPLALLAAWIVGAAENRWQPTAGGLAIGLGIALLAIAWCYGASRLTEAHTDAMRRRAELLLARFSRAGAALTSPPDTRR